MHVVQQPQKLGLQAMNDVLLAPQERMTEAITEALASIDGAHQAASHIYTCLKPSQS